jgi:uncharacterized protein (TIGR00730 family)
LIRRICVFCGSSLGRQGCYAQAAESLAIHLVQCGIGIVYGGAGRGLMGLMADTALAAGGEVIGVMPQAMVDREIAHRGLSKLHIVGSMHERKALMAELADAFIAMPGGFGTFEEFCEVLTWNQLGIQNKPCGLLNVNGYYDPLLRLFDDAVSEGFVKPENRSLVIASNSVETLVTAFRADG